MALTFDKKTISILIVIVIIIQATAFAQEASLTNINVSNNRDDLLLFFTLDGAFREKLKTAISSGVPATFSFYISLYRVRDLWFDRKIADLKLTHTVKYDNLKKEYTVKRVWDQREPAEPVVTQSFEEAQRLMTEIDSLRIYPLKRLTKGRQYQIRAMAEVSKITLPFSLHYVVFFVSFWDFETDWYTIDFIY